MRFYQNRLREIFIPKKRIPIKTTEEAQEYRRLYSGKKNIYVSVYEYVNDISGANAIVDRIFLDFDYDKDMKFFDDVRTVAKFLYDSSYTFCIRFSGRGFHIFILLPSNHYATKTSIRGWVQDMHKKTNTKSDSSVVGDLRRVSRMLGSMNLKTHLYCIPITYAELMSFTYEGICEMAKEYKISDDIDWQEADFIFADEWHYGNNSIDLSLYKQESPQNIKVNVGINNIKVEQNPPACIENMLKDPNLGYYARGMLILYLRDDGYGFEQILGILKIVLSEHKYYHCTVEEGQPAYLYFVREDLLFPSCRTLKDNGLCCSDTCDGHHLYL